MSLNKNDDNGSGIPGNELQSPPLQSPGLGQQIEPQADARLESVVVSSSDPKNEQGIKPSVEPPNAGEGDQWAPVVDALDKFDSHMVESGKESIDSYLTFAGIFSVVLTAFTTSSLQLLQFNSTQSTPLILAQISKQLSDLRVSSGSITSASAAYTLQAPSRPSPLAIIVNILWFASLLLSLISASIGILVRQWLQEYTASTSSQPYDSVCIRQYRFDGYNQWRVNLFMSTLPFLLQMALLLFFIGIPIFLWTIDRAVASVATGLIVVWLICWMATLVFPVLYSNCPFKSAEASVLNMIASSTKTILVEFFQCRLHFGTLAKKLHTSWRESEIKYIKNNKALLGWGTVKRARDDLIDELVFADAMHAYLQEKKDDRIAVDVIAQSFWEYIKQNMSGCSEEDLIWDWIPDASKVTCALMNVCVDVVKLLEDHEMQHTIRDKLVVLLTRYAFHRGKDASDRQNIQFIGNLPLQVNLGGFPLKCLFLNAMNSKMTPNSGISVINEISQKISQLWLSRRRTWRKGQYNEFSEVITAFLTHVNGLDPLAVAARINAGQLAHFVAFLTDLAGSLQYQSEMKSLLDYGEVQNPKDQKVITTAPEQNESMLPTQLTQSDMVASLKVDGAIYKLRFSIHDIARKHPALRNELKDCVTWSLALYDTSLSHAVQDSQLKGDATHHLSSELYDSTVQDNWFSLSIREEIGTSKSNSVIIESKLSLVLGGPIDVIRFSPDGRFLGIVVNKEVRVYERTDDDWQPWIGATAAEAAEIQCLCFSLDSQYLVYGTSDGAIKKLRFTTTDSTPCTMSWRAEVSVLSLEYSNNGRLLSRHVNGNVRLWESDFSKSILLCSENSEGQHAAFSCATIAPNERWVATGSSDGRIQIWDVEIGTVIEEYTEHKNVIRSIEFTSDSSAVVSDGEDWTVKVHHIADPLDISTKRDSLILRGPMDEINAVALSPDNEWIAAVSADTNIYFWDAYSGCLRGFVDGHKGRIRSIHFCPYGNTFATDDDSGTVRIWAYKTINEHQETMSAV